MSELQVIQTVCAVVYTGVQVLAYLRQRAAPSLPRPRNEWLPDREPTRRERGRN